MPPPTLVPNGARAARGHQSGQGVRPRCDRRASPRRGFRFLKLDEVKRRAGLEKSMIYRLILEGKFPAPYKLSPGAARWSEHELVAWIEEVKDGFEGKKRRV
jgi:prophage regulatory protein